MTPDYIWRKLGTESILRTPYYSVQRDRLRHPQGHELDYYVIEHTRQGVGVPPIGDQGGEPSVLLVQQWRHTVQKLVWCIPAGGMEAGETPIETAARELLEETGNAARDLAPLYAYHPSIGLSNQTFHLFLARRLSRAGEHDAAEIQQVRFFTKAQIETMLARQELVDGMSVVALLLWLRMPASA